MTDPDPEHVSPRTSPHPEIAIPTDADVAAAAKEAAALAGALDGVAAEYAGALGAR